MNFADMFGYHTEICSLKPQMTIMYSHFSNFKYSNDISVTCLSASAIISSDSSVEEVEHKLIYCHSHMKIMIIDTIVEWGCKIVQSLWETVWQFHIKLNIHILHYTAKSF